MGVIASQRMLESAIGLTWVRESTALWDAGKQNLVAKAPPGIFDERLRTSAAGSLVPGEWWRVERSGRTVGYGWMDVVWGDAEILLVTDRESRNDGVGSFILDSLEKEARARGLAYLYNVVRSTHPDGARVAAWLKRRGFTESPDGRLLRSVGTR